MNSKLRDLHYKRGVLKKNLGIDQRGDLAPGVMMTKAQEIRKLISKDSPEPKKRLAILGLI